MVVVNKRGEIVLLNVQAEKQFGYRRDELLGQKVTNIIPEGFAERLIADGMRSAEDARAQRIGTGRDHDPIERRGLAAGKADRAGVGIDRAHRRSLANSDAALAQEPHQVGGDAGGKQRAALGTEIGVAEGRGIEERVAPRGVFRLEQFVGRAHPVEALPVGLAVVARDLRDPHHAAGRIMPDAEIGPELVPGGEGLGDGAGIAVGAAIGAPDDAMLVARRRIGIGDLRRLLEQGDLMAELVQRPGGGQAGDAGSDDGDLHPARLSLS